VKPVVVDFWESWCVPCRQLSPVIETLAAEHGDRVTFAKLDTDANLASANAAGVKGLPTVHVYVAGELVQAFQGARV
jgi:thioredoxin 1